MSCWIKVKLKTFHKRQLSALWLPIDQNWKWINVKQIIITFVESIEVGEKKMDIKVKGKSINNDL